MEIKLPTYSLHDLLAVLSFYKTCPGCRIGFVPPRMEARIIADDMDIVQTVYESLDRFRQGIRKGVLFGVQFVPNGEWKYDPESFMGNDSSRCYAHEFQERKKEEEKKEYQKSPLVLLERQDSYLSYSSKGRLGGKLLTCCEYLTRKQISGAIGIDETPPCNNFLGVEDMQVCPGCGKQIPDDYSVCFYCQYDIDGKVKPASTPQQDDKIFGCGWEPYVIPNNANVIQSVTPYWPIKTLMAVLALGLFETYLVGRRIVVDGCRNKNFLVPLSLEPLTLEYFRLLHRHPKIWRHWDNGAFWKQQGLVGCKMFTLRKVSKYGTYYEPRG